MAVKATRVDVNFNPFPEGANEHYFIYTEQSAPYAPGTNQYEDINLRVECMPAGNLPQPKAFVPVDYQNVQWSDTPPISISAGSRMLVVRKAFFWENSEDQVCPHGPWGQIGLQVYPSYIGENYSLEQLAANPAIFFNAPNYSVTKLPGPIWFADEDCAFSTSDAYSEWIDGPWGCCYSNIGVFNWDEHPSISKITLICSEADATWGPFGSEDDFLGATVVNRDDDFILFKVWMAGWVLLQNVDIPENGEESVDVGQRYWFNNWNGSYPSNSQLETQYQYDQYRPLASRTIPQMEAIFPANTTVGLMGGKFPIGMLSKPMIYKAVCEPAIFDQN